MKFFHVYNEQFFEGLVKNGLINEDTGFKLQHNWSMPTELKFNKIAARGGKLHKLITEKRYPFYIDRITGGTAYHKYVFDKDLIDEYEDTLGEWFLGFQLHESASNRRNDWNGIIRRMDGNKGPYDVEELKAVFEEFGAAILDASNGCFVVELSASSHRIDEFLERTKSFEMIEMCRSGAIAMERGLVDYDI